MSAISVVIILLLVVSAICLFRSADMPSLSRQDALGAEVIAWLLWVIALAIGAYSIFGAYTP